MFLDERRSYPTRCVHLDFHTSEYIENIGEYFSEQEFAETIKKSNIESITLFAKCHHGWSYYDTKIGERHPHLKFDLLGSQMMALQQAGIKVPVYYTVGWSQRDVEKFPECIYRDKFGVPIMSSGKFYDEPDAPRAEASWVTLCPSGRYAEMIYAQVNEICEKYERIDGMFFDIVFSSPHCYCANCVKRMLEEGIDLNDETMVETFSIRKFSDFCEEINRIIHKYHPNATVFFNSGGHYSLYRYHKYLTHYEIEDLPSVWGGYNKLPLEANYFASLHKYYLGMTGKFHTMWGEFGGNKSAAALKVEAAMMLTYGAGMSIGDQLHPCGKLDVTTYSIIGEVFSYYKILEEYCLGGEAVTDLAIMPSYIADNDEGVVRILLENGIDFKVKKQIDTLNDISCLIIPDGVDFSVELADKLSRFVAGGGKILFCGLSLLDVENGCFALDIGGEYMGASQYDVDYIAPNLNGIFSDSPIVMYHSGQNVVASDGESLGAIYEPYFSRTFQKFCSHMNTPYKLQPSAFACGIKKGNVVYLPHNIGALYNRKGAQLHKEFFMAALRIIYNGEIVKTDLGSQGRVRFIRKKDKYVLNLMYFLPVKRGEVEMVEDILTLKDRKVEISLSEKVTRVYSIQQNRNIPFRQEQKVSFLCDIPNGHQTIVIEYEE